MQGCGHLALLGRGGRRSSIRAAFSRNSAANAPHTGKRATNDIERTNQLALRKCVPPLPQWQARGALAAWLDTLCGSRGRFAQQAMFEQ
jgi:hypothetical protein